MKKNIALLFFIVSVTCYSQTVVIKEADKIINLATHSFYLEDADANLTIKDVLKKEMASTFKKVDKPFINFGVSSSAFWIKCNVRNETDQDLFIELGNTTLTDILLYEIDSTGLLAKHHSGNWLPFKMRETNDVTYQFKLAVNPKAAEVFYLRVLHYRGTQFPFVIGTKEAFNTKSSSKNLLEGMFYGFMLVMVLYNLFIYFSLRDNAYLFYVLYIFFMGTWNAILNGYAFKYIWPSLPYLSQYAEAVACLVGISGLLFATNFLHTKYNAPFLHKLLYILLGLYVVTFIILVSGKFMVGTIILEVITLITVMSFFVTAYYVLGRGYKPAGYFLLAWSLLLVSVIIFILKDFNIVPYNSITRHSMQIGSAIEALLLSMALANRINILKKEKDEAHLETLASLQENKKLITQQNILLEKKVEKRTQELQGINKELITAMQELREAQTQLVQREKMASLGELTAGIAHEIQNPLNFVNNFSEVSNELLDDMNGEIDKGNLDEVKTIATDVKQNLEKILRHGKQADGIVKGMLQHSRSSIAAKEPTDINKLADEYLRLAYHGLRAKDKDFNTELKTEYDESIGNINIIPPDIGRVLLNLYNNAFYALAEKKKKQLDGYEPTISINTKKTDDKVSISVKDNGDGIPPKILDKIFQPFFTTKPTGQGTGLGLSLSYDIIKAHGGELKVETTEGIGGTFIITLPLS